MAKRKNPSDEQGQDNDNLNDDSFGLPDLEYKPLETTEQSTTSTTTEETKPPVSEGPTHTETKETTSSTSSTYSSSYMEEEEKSKTPIVIGVVVAVLLVVFVGLYYMFVYRPGQADKERLAKEDEAKRIEEAETLRKRQAAEEAERLRQQHIADSLNAIPKVGTITTLSERTRRYYVVITSAVDGDLVMDRAKKLSEKGVSTKIIPPFGKYKFSRLAIGDFDSFASAQASADAVKNEYGGAVWVLKF